MSNLSNRSILVTGGAGFIGSHLVDRLVGEKPKRLIVVDNFCLGEDKIRNLLQARSRFPSLKVYHQDAAKMRLMKRILIDEGIEVVFNLAVTCLPASLVKPKWVHDVNVTITSTFCELLRRDLYDTLIHFSSSEVYGDAKQVPMDENHPLDPYTPYAASKIASDHLIFSYCKTFGVDASIIRPFNNYGPRQNEGTYAGVIPLTIKRILKGESPVIFGDGLQTRDYTYVTDTAEAAVKIYSAKSTRGKVLNIASGEETTIKDLVSKIAKIMGSKKPIIYDNPRPGDVRRFIGSNHLARELINYEAKVSFDEGLRRTIDWYRDIHSSRHNSALPVKEKGVEQNP